MRGLGAGRGGSDRWRGGAVVGGWRPGAGDREGREARYRVIPERLGVTARWMDRVAATWDTRLSAIKRLAEGE